MNNLRVYTIPAVCVLFFGGFVWIGLYDFERKKLERKDREDACAGTYTIWVTTGGNLSYGYETDYYSNDGDLIVFTNNCNGKEHITPKTSILEIREN